MTSVLFICNLNSVRSPMAAAYLRSLTDRSDLEVDSAGVYEGWLDPFVMAVMEEIDISLDDHEPKAMSELPLAGFDAVIALTHEAAAEIRRLCPECEVEIWEIDNPSSERGDRDTVMAAYRRVRDELRERIRSRFPATTGQG